MLRRILLWSLQFWQLLQVCAHTHQQPDIQYNFKLVKIKNNTQDPNVFIWPIYNTIEIFSLYCDKKIQLW